MINTISAVSGIVKLSYPPCEKASATVVMIAIKPAKIAASDTDAPLTKIGRKKLTAKAAKKNEPEPMNVLLLPNTVYFPTGQVFPTKPAIGSHKAKINIGI